MARSENKTSFGIWIIAGKGLWLICFYTMLGVMLFYAYQWNLSHGPMDIAGALRGF